MSADASTATATPPVVVKALAKIGDIATLPEVTLRVIEIVENPRSTARDLHEVIKTDPALSSKILKVVNSSFYGLPGQIASVDRAIVMLGLSAVKNIAIAASMARLFKSDKLTEEYSAADLWKHSVAVAVASRALARAAGNQTGAEEVFLAGLIHDLGMLAERQTCGDMFTDVIRKCSAGEGAFVTLEDQIIGANHQSFGEALCAKWKFPKHLRAVVGNHHDPSRVSPEFKKMVTLVHVADVLACQLELGFNLSAKDEPILPDDLATIGIDDAQLEEIRAELPEATDAAEATLSSH